MGSRVHPLGVIQQGDAPLRGAGPPEGGSDVKSDAGMRGNVPFGGYFRLAASEKLKNLENLITRPIGGGFGGLAP